MMFFHWFCGIYEKSGFLMTWLIYCTPLLCGRPCSASTPCTELLVRFMDFKQGLDQTKNTPIVRKAKLGIKLKVIMSFFISWLSSGQKSVASYCKMGRKL